MFLRSVALTGDKTETKTGSYLSTGNRGIHKPFQVSSLKAEGTDLSSSLLMVLSLPRIKDVSLSASSGIS